MKTASESLLPDIRRAGFVAIVGRPNVGKSTLLNRVVGEKLAIASPRPQTTRNRILAVRNVAEEGAQLALVDTPGLHRPHGKGRSVLNGIMVDEARSALADVDVVLVVTDLRGLGSGGTERSAHEPGVIALDGADEFVLQELRQAGKPVVLAVNKVDLLPDKRRLLPLMNAWATRHAFKTVVPISAQTGDGVDLLLHELCATLPEGPALFPAEMLTDRAERWLVAELVREQLFLQTRQEIPYAVAVTIDNWEERIGAQGKRQGERVAAVVDATIHVEKDAQKKIVVGDGGQRIRAVGTAAREEIERLLGCKVHLALFVRVDEDWTNRPRVLRDLGYEGPTPRRRHST